MNLARAAYMYAHHGRRVFPLVPGTKRPATEHGVKDATIEPLKIRTWWKRWPSANIGLAILAHEIVVDVDVRSGGDQTLLQWLEQTGDEIPRTPTQTTPTTGSHFFFRRPEGFDLVNKPAGKKGGIDVLGIGKYVVAAPSRITGRTDPYEWTTRLSTTPLADLPDWLATLVLRPAVSSIELARPSRNADASIVERAERWLEKADPAIQGQGGSSTCFRVTSRLVRGFNLDEETALALLERIYNPKCAPPWSRRELKHKIKQAVARGNCAWGALLEERRSA